MLRRVRGEVVLQQIADVVAPLAERQDVDVNHVQPVVEILAEIAGRDALAQVPVGGADDPHVDAIGGAVVGADRLDFARLQESQQQRLHPQRHLADLVEEQRALVGLLEEARLVAIGVGEAAFDVAEELRLEQRIGQAGAVQGAERLRTARAAVVDQLRGDFLADTAFAGDEDLGVGARGGGDVTVERARCRGGTHEGWRRRSHISGRKESERTPCMACVNSAR